VISLIAGGDPEQPGVRVLIGLSSSDLKAMGDGRVRSLHLADMLARIPEKHRDALSNTPLGQVDVDMFSGGSDEKMAEVIQNSKLNDAGADLVSETRKMAERGEATSISLRG
jgi:hypothetical protein